MINHSIDILSLGRVVCDLGTTHGAALRGINVLSIKPAIRINGTPHYSVDDIDRLASHLKAKRLKQPETRHDTDVRPKDRPS